MSINQPFTSSSNVPLGQPQTHPQISSNGNPTSTINTPLKPIKSESGFEFPAIWSFPPFFTLQPNPSTLNHQLELWRTLVLKWAKYERVFEVNVDSIEIPGVFENKRIKRRLLPSSMKRIFQEMMKNGEAAPDPPKQDTKYLIYWKKPEEWGDLVYTWVMDNGLNSSIMTFYEITDGDLSHTTEFYELPTSILRKALESLVKRGKAQLLEGKGEVGEGVRFL
ncbi:hypothetical protein I203_107039 [Kwoniella mangroviensis CBS 8507]|uniref:hypothetical protein n=1 Tax=Kwoniella mangroviensis CBS 8507 TaxID=1296122 RepID=UPI00080D0FFD|nr:ESCRT-II complex subunit VPS25 [Kwoniella mangroviensis CBS 8507]OCF68404.1 ESCRT-II complex subunit VPS25 [Kwoniella mangroviensis CBS 8507]